MSRRPQLGLFDPRPEPSLPAATVFDGPSKTSRDAARSKRPTAGSDEARVMFALLDRPDTDDGVEERLSMRHQNCSARRRSLVLKGIVASTGRTRKTRSGRKAQVWEVTPEGREVAKKVGYTNTGEVSEREKKRIRDRMGKV